MKVKVTSRDGKVLVESFELKGDADKATVGQLKRAYAAARPAMYVERQRWTSGKKVLDDDSKTLWSYRVADGDALVFKDLGPQIGWKTVFLIEYGGPLLIYPIFFFFRDFIYRTDLFEPTQVQQLAFLMLMAHFIKRELETLFVHRFSNATMPLFNVFKNSAHYWGLSGILVAWHVFQPQAADAWQPSETYVSVCLALYMFGQVSNFMTHWTLRNLRPPGSKERKIPYGFGFNMVSCPNYFFEAMSWAAVLLLTRSWAVLVFFVFAVGQMYVWAVKKHKAYLKDFKNYPKNRKAMFPFIA